MSKMKKRKSFSGIFPREINDKNWFCIVVLLIEKDASNNNYIKAFESSANRGKYTNIVSITPDVLPKIRHPRVSRAQSFNKRKSTVSKDIENNYYKGKEQAQQVKKFILDFMVNAENQMEKRENDVTNELEVQSPKLKDDKSNNIINDEPSLGPQYYFVMSSFYEPTLPLEMIGVKIPFNCIIAVGNTDETKRTENRKYSEAFSGSNQHHVDKAANFWNQFNELLLIEDISIKASDILILPYSTQQNSSSEEGKYTVYDRIANTLYKLQEYIQNHQKYINSIEIVEVSEYVPPEDGLYKSMVKLVSSESTEIDYILHCIVEQVVLNTNGVSPIQLSEEVIPNYDGKIRIDNAEAKSWVNLTPTLIKSSDIIGNVINNDYKYDTDISKLNLNIITNMPYINIWNTIPLQNENKKNWYEAQLQSLQRYMDWKVPEFNFKLFLHQLIFTKIYRVSNETKKLHSYDLPHSKQYTIPLPRENSIQNMEDIFRTTYNFSEFYPNKYENEKRKMDILNLANFLESREILSLSKQFFHYDKTEYSRFKFNEYLYIERLDNTCLLQALHKAFTDYSCLDYYYDPLTDNILFGFHDNMNINGISLSVAEGFLSTPLGFRDYYKFVHSVDQNKSMADNTKNHNCSDELCNKNNIELLDKAELPNSKISFGIGPTIVQIKEFKKSFYAKDNSEFHVKTSKWTSQPNINVTIISKKVKNVLTCQYYSSCERNVINSKVYFTLELVNNTLIAFDSQIITAYIELEKIESSTGSPKDKAWNKGATKRLNNKRNSKKIERTSTKPKIPVTTIEYKMCTTLPTGLKISLVKGNEEYIKQEYISKGAICQNISNEDYRLYFRNGTILIFRINGHFDVLYPNGTITKITKIKKIDEETTIIDPLVNIMQEDNIKKNKKISINEKILPKQSKQQSIKPITELKELSESGIFLYNIISHEVLSWSGETYQFLYGSNVTSKDVCELKFHTVDAGNDLYIKRSDGVNFLFKNDSSLCIDHIDGTRITTKTEKSEPISGDINEEDLFLEEYQIMNYQCLYEHPSYATIKYSNKVWTISLQEDTEIRINSNGTYNINIGKNTVVELSNEKVIFSSHNKKDKKSVTKFNLNSFTYENTFCCNKDSDSNFVSIDIEGNICNLSYPQQMKSFKQNSQFFVCNRKLNGYQFVHNNDYLKLVEDAQTNTPYSTCSVCKTSYHANGVFKTIQKPVFKKKWEIFLMPYKEDPLTCFRRNLLSKPVSSNMIWFFSTGQNTKLNQINSQFPEKKHTHKESIAILIKNIVCINPKKRNILHILQNAIELYSIYNKEILAKYSNNSAYELINPPEINQSALLVAKCYPQVIYDEKITDYESIQDNIQTQTYNPKFSYPNYFRI